MTGSHLEQDSQISKSMRYDDISPNSSLKDITDRSMISANILQKRQHNPSSDTFNLKY